MSDLLGRLDAAITGACPCGAEPRDGSAYCSYDCEPNHLGVHTDRRETGPLATPMRWRPDLVTDVDDSDLVLVHTGPRGDFTASLYRYQTAGRPLFHLRVDDGCRFVGLDVTDESEVTDGFDPLWDRLERELTNVRHVEAGVDPHTFFRDLASRMYRGRADEDPWADVFPRVPAPTAGDRFRVQLHPSPLSAAETVPSVFIPGHVWTVRREDLLRSAEAVSRTAEAISQGVSRALEEINRRFRRLVPAAVNPVEPQHPMLAAIEARRTRNTGPQRRQRAPRQINPGRR